MKALVLYRPNSEFARSVEEFVHDFKSRTDKRIELMSIDTREGASTAALYDVMQFPSVLAIQDNGSLAKSWTGEHLPLVNDVAGYLVG